MNTYGDKADMLDATTLMVEGQEGEYDYTKWVNNIMDVVGDYDIVFIPVAEKLLDAINKRKIDYDVFYPSKERRGEFLENMVRKRAFRNDIMMLDRDFDKMVDRIDNIEAENCYKHKMNEQGHFIGNDNAIMQYINNIKQNPVRNEKEHDKGVEESARGEEADERN
jgi:hypothetical protein